MNKLHSNEGRSKGTKNAPRGQVTGMTPKPAGKPKGGKALSQNPNLKGGSGSY